MPIIYQFFPKNPVFSKEELLRLSNIFDNAGQVILGVLVFSPLVTAVDTLNPFMVIWGTIGTFGCWFLSIYLTKIAQKEK